jgi:exodeoxyribonuclease-3
LVSNLPFDASYIRTFCDMIDSRHVSVTFGGEAGLAMPLVLHNFYVPAGGDIPDPEVNPKFRHKLDMVEELTGYFADRKGDGARLVLVGDLNIAPLETDVWSHRQLLGVVSHTPVETRLLGEAQAAFEWIDSTRHFIPPQEKIYSWWSYRAADWEESDRGRRLDHVWASPGLKGTLKAHKIVKKMRGWQKASDHVPVVVEFKV